MHAGQLPSGIPLLDALAGCNHGRPPLWIMRQAGRALASYRELRKGVDFLDFCKNVDLATEATLIPVRELPVQAAILFADIVLPLEALGRTIEFHPKVGPVIRPPVRNGREAAKLKMGRVGDVCGYIGQIVQRLRQELPREVALIGFAPSPWTLAAYLVEGQGNRGFPTLKSFAYGDPEGFAGLLDTLTDLLIAYADIQVRAGVQVFQVFDTWAELAPPAWFERLVAPRIARQLAAVREIPTIYFPKGTAAFVDTLALLPAGTGFGCDWTVELAALRRRLGPSVALQGNLDPAWLLTTPQAIRRATFQLLDSMTGDAAYIANLGHGLHPQTPEANVHAFAKAVREWEPRV